MEKCRAPRKFYQIDKPGTSSSAKEDCDVMFDDSGN